MKTYIIYYYHKDEPESIKTYRVKEPTEAKAVQHFYSIKSYNHIIEDIEEEKA